MFLLVTAILHPMAFLAAILANVVGVGPARAGAGVAAGTIAAAFATTLAAAS